MNQIFLTALLLTAPILTVNLKSNRKGLLCGLFTTLIFLCYEMSPWLLSVPAFCGFLIFLTSKSDDNHKSIKIPFSFTPLLMAFLAAVAVIVGFGSAIDCIHAEAPAYISVIGLMFGPVYFGASLDKRGFIFPWISFLLLLEVGILFSLLSGFYLNILGRYLFYFCQGGFYVLLAKTISLLYGPNRFIRLYGFTTIWIIGFLCITSRISDPSISIILSAIAPLLIFLVWQRRYVLLVDKE